MSPAFNELQDLLWPEIGLCTEFDLYFHRSEGARVALQKKLIFLPKGEWADFGTYGNLFNMGKWCRVCGIEDVSLRIDGTGLFEINIYCVRENKSKEQIFSDVRHLDGCEVIQIPKEFDTRSVIYVEMKSLEDSVLRGICWGTYEPPRRDPSLMLSITTFRREEAVKKTVSRFEEFINASKLSEKIHLCVVDNGQTAPVTSSEHVTVIKNENLGGSGGFSRGLLEARSRGASHCLFMDDDASVHMQAIERTWIFFAYAKDENVAVAGALADAQDRWKLWENGATFDHICHPMNMGLDLRNMHQVFDMELHTINRRPPNFYGGWWYYAFPVKEAKHMPFPYFVRGDDVSFSLAHDFDIVTLPGVITFQEEDFTIKESPLTVYLDLRSHLTHHLALPRMEIGATGINKIVMRFWLRALLACHYETLDAISLAVSDVVQGPDYFLSHADVSERRKQISGLTNVERWKQNDETEHRGERVWLPAHNFFARALMKLTLNGHLLPGFCLVGNHIWLSARDRGNRRAIWGASEITYVSIDGEKKYTVRHSKLRFMKNAAKILPLMWKISKNYSQIRDAWQNGYRNMTTPESWKSLLNME